MKFYDAVVIGGGIVGCATAFELAKRGVTDVLLVEKGFLTSGATGRCGAGIRQQWGSELNARLALESGKAPRGAEGRGVLPRRVHHPGRAEAGRGGLPGGRDGRGDRRL